MKTLKFVIIAVLILSGLYFVYSYLFKAPKNDFNIVLITIDALRADHLSCYGYERKTSPNIDKIADKGTLFRNAIAPSAWTSPSMVSLFTSVYPINHGVTKGINVSIRKNKKEVFSAELITVAEILKSMGYKTFGITSNMLLQKQFGFGRGFDYFTCLWNWTPADSMNKVIFAWEDQIKKADKFFLWVHYTDTHLPYHARKPWFDQYITDNISSREFNLAEKNVRKLRKLIPFLKKDQRLLSDLVALYDSEINFVDFHIGKLIDKLKLDKNTLIIITSDHGEGFLEHGNIDHGYGLYNELLHIPLIIKLPYSPKKERVDTLVNLVDVVPSILQVLQVDFPSHLLGKPFQQRISQNISSKNITNTNNPLAETFSELDTKNVKAIITPEWKYIYNFKNKTEQLYNRKKDTLDLKNLSAKQKRQCSILKEELFGWILNAKKYPVQWVPFLPSPEEEAKLRALGYIK